MKTILIIVKNKETGVVYHKKLLIVDEDSTIISLQTPTEFKEFDQFTPDWKEEE